MRPGTFPSEGPLIRFVPLWRPHRPHMLRARVGAGRAFRATDITDDREAPKQIAKGEHMTSTRTSLVTVSKHLTRRQSSFLR